MTTRAGSAAPYASGKEDRMTGAQEAARITQANLERKSIADDKWLNDEFNGKVSDSVSRSCTMSIWRTSGIRRNECETHVVKSFIEGLRGNGYRVDDTTTFDRDSLNYGYFHVYW